MIMIAKPIRLACVAALALQATWFSPVLFQAQAQERGKAKDDALDSLLEDLKKDDPAAKKAAKKSEAAKAKLSSGSESKQKSKDGASSGQGAGKPGSAAPGGAKPAPKGPKASPLAPKDQALDDLLGKLGESKDEPAREDRPQGQAPGGGERTKGAGAGNKERVKLGGKDKEIDQELEELAGRKRKRPNGDDGERTGEIGEMIKEMRDVEKRLGKPDSGEDTQAKQKQIVKRIETLIEQVRQSGSSAGRLTIRRRVRQGNQPGQQEGDQTGALAQGARAMKPEKPTSQHSTAGGKGVWGHLPEELRQVMENTFKEEALTSKTELISRYFLSVGKDAPRREGE
jgi:hypothetical protein